MSQIQDDFIVDHLETAMEACDGNEEARYHIRSALQLLAGRE